MKPQRRKVYKTFICSSNVVFTISGFVLMSLGVVLLMDSERILMSRLIGPDEVQLDQPLFYYFGFGFVALGFTIVVTGLFGCWLSCLPNCCINASYMTIVVLLLLSEMTFCSLAVFWPNLLAIDIRPTRLVRALQRNYGLPGREQFTAALDFTQTVLSCCGINGSNNYGTSWWRLQEIGRRNLVVPFTCCTLNNTDGEAFLNPIVKDLDLCQNLNPAKHQSARHVKGCLGSVEEWTQQQILILLIIGLSLIVLQIFVLSSVIFVCSNKSKISSEKKNKMTSSFTSTQTLTPHPQFIDADYNFELGIEKASQIIGSTLGRKS